MLHSALVEWVKVTLEEKERQVRAQQEKLMITLTKARDEVRILRDIDQDTSCMCLY